VGQKWGRLDFLNSSVKNQPILVIFGTLNPEETRSRCLQTYPPHL